jgi:hypothetical protein
MTANQLCTVLLREILIGSAKRYILRMKIELEKSSGRGKCRSGYCKQNPEYISENGRIKAGTTCVAITMRSAAGRNVSYYCRECVDQLYEDVKKILNPKLWVFH